jgi:hypothetical protein
MTETRAALNDLFSVLAQKTLGICDRLQPGLSVSEIETQVAVFNWISPQDAFDLYQWHQWAIKHSRGVESS